MSHNTGKVFISHSSSDKAFVDRLASDLTSRGIPVWYDKFDIGMGESIVGEINEGIASAKYFLIVLSPAALESRWVNEELNAALLRQITEHGTFVFPLILTDCEIPPLLKHRRYTDFREDYQQGLQELLSIWSKDAMVSAELSDKTLYPWPDAGMIDTDFVYLYSTRFDKFFRMSCSLSWTVEKITDYIVETLSLPRCQAMPKIDIELVFTYELMYNGSSMPPQITLADAGLQRGDTVRLSIHGACKVPDEGVTQEIWDGGIMYDLMD